LGFCWEILGEDLRKGVPCLKLAFQKREVVINSLQEVGGGRGDWIDLAQVRDRWRALVCRVRDFRVP
jgi:hypothetical protein